MPFRAGWFGPWTTTWRDPNSTSQMSTHLCTSQTHSHQSPGPCPGNTGLYTWRMRMAMDGRCPPILLYPSCAARATVSNTAVSKANFLLRSHSFLPCLCHVDPNPARPPLPTLTCSDGLRLASLPAAATAASESPRCSRVPQRRRDCNRSAQCRRRLFASPSSPWSGELSLYIPA